MPKREITIRTGFAAILIVASSGVVTSCATPGKDTAIGAGGGAIGGATIGGLVGGGKGALIGAAAGALVGGAVGNYLDKQANELKQVANTQRTANGIVVNLNNDLLFDTGKSDLKPEAQTQLTQLGQIIAKYPKDHITIKGYTDSSGSKQTNQMLSQLRAQAVSTMLANQGVKPTQMDVQGLGPAEPIADNKTPAGRAKNRRVELQIQVPEKNQS